MLVLGFLTSLLLLLCMEGLVRQLRRPVVAVDAAALHDQILAYHLDWKAIQDQKFLIYLYVKKVNAVVRYQALAGVSHEEASHAIEYLLAHPELLPQIPQKRRPALPQADDERLQAYLADGRINDAVQLFQDLVDVDLFTAQQVIERMQTEITLENIETAAISDEETYGNRHTSQR